MALLEYQTKEYDLMLVAEHSPVTPKAANPDDLQIPMKVYWRTGNALI